MLQLKNICKSYTTGDFTQVALNDVSISFRDNEFVAILGPSGSGKTTLLNVMGGLDHYDSGDMIVDGISTHRYKDRDWDTFRNNRIGFVFQSYNLIPHQTILQNVELALTLSGVGKAERTRRAKEALASVGLSEHLNKKPSQLSVRCSASPSPARSSTIRRSCWPTSPPARLTPIPRCRSWTCSLRSPRTVWSSWSPTTRSWRPSTPRAR